MKPFPLNHECGIKMRLKLPHCSVECQKFVGAVLIFPQIVIRISETVKQRWRFFISQDVGYHHLEFCCYSLFLISEICSSQTS